MPRDTPVTDGIHADVQSMQPTRRHPPLDRASAKAEQHELTPRNHTVLELRELGDRKVMWAL
jgi:hypothetical protein